MQPNRSWETISCRNPYSAPSPRSLHAGAVRKDALYIFGGYNGTTRLNDLYEYNFKLKNWRLLIAFGRPPSPRDRHSVLVYKDVLYLFGGFDGIVRKNDLFRYIFEKMTWGPVNVLSGIPPTPRHSHAVALYGSAMYVFGGYDGSYRNDFHMFDFETSTWTLIAAAGIPPKPRYRSSLVVHKNTCILFGGHDGTHHLNDLHTFNFEFRTWTSVSVEGISPVPRDSHVAVMHCDSMYIFGGSTGSALNDLHEFNLGTRRWQPSLFSGTAPEQRFCHVGVAYRSELMVFGGYDGRCRLSDFKKICLGKNAHDLIIPENTLASDLRSFVNNACLSDVTFIVKGEYIYGHKILCARCEYFKTMFTCEMMESRTKEIEVTDVRRDIFLMLLEFLYCDNISLSLDTANELLVVADRYGVDRLKRLCEKEMLGSISIANVTSILYAADVHNAAYLRDECFHFMINYFDAVTKSKAFEEMGRRNMDLVFELLRRR